MKMRYGFLYLCFLFLLGFIVPESFANLSAGSDHENGTLSPLKTVTVHNKAGVLLRTRYFQYAPDGSCCRVKTESFPLGSKRTYKVPEGSEIYLHAIALGGWSKCARIDPGVDSITCSRASLNLHCYSHSHGHTGHSVRGTRQGGCEFVHLVFRPAARITSLQNIMLKPGDENDIILMNTGATLAKKLSFDFMEASSQQQSEGFAGYFHNEKTGCYQGISLYGSGSRLKPGNFCLLHYRIPKNPLKNGTGDFRIVSTDAKKVNRASLSFHVLTPALPEFQNHGLPVAKLLTGSGDTGSITIKNRGEISATDFKLVFSDSKGKKVPALASHFSGSCMEDHVLALGEICELHYTFPPRSETGSYFITATGKGLGHNTRLELNLVTQGHLVFMKDNAVMTEMLFAPKSHGRFIVKNTGALPVSHLQFTFVDGPGNRSTVFRSYFTIACQSGDSLAPDDFCTVKYDIPDHANLKVLYSLSVSGTGRNVNHPVLMMFRNVAYVSKFSIPAVQLCTLDEKGVFTGCATALNNLDGEGTTNLVFQRYGKVIRAYVTNATNQIRLCLVDLVTGVLNRCQDSGLKAEYLNVTTSIAFSLDGLRAYIGAYSLFKNDSSHVITTCDVDRTTGFLHHCKASMSGFTEKKFQGVQSMTLNPLGNRMYLAYFLSGLSSGIKVVKCSLNRFDGVVSNCVPAYDKQRGFSSFDITFLNTDAVYIAKFSGKKVTLCHVDSNGIFKSCSDSGAPGVEYALAVTVNHDLHKVYISNQGSHANHHYITMCFLNDDGHLSECQNMPGSFYSAEKIAFYPHATVYDTD